MELLRDKMQKVKDKALLFAKTGKYDAGEKLLTTVVKEYGPMAHLHNLLGFIFHKQSRFREAMEQFRLAKDINPGFSDSSYNLLATLCDVGLYSLAEELFLEIHAQERSGEKKHLPLEEKKLASKHLACGKQYVSMERYEEALMEFSRALSLFPDMMEAKLWKGKAYFKTREFQKSVQELEDLTRIHPSCAQGYIWLGLAQKQLGRNDDAFFSWEKAVKLDPKAALSQSLLKIYSTPPKNSSYSSDI